ncbi:e3 ubiquitin-protein ligase UHRF1 [Caerostris darwini]|uniref:E3 ubiquitin-protein ligase UHRF1 n=1 Tax=Caerostris darwini TaxID=1538125 RepID=A0AAV4R5P0_9ARAC|nr:e3 ubiquitin-protein ligase UHRF1 [Caerostris darwini]
MWIQIRSMDGKISSHIDGLSKLTKIEDLRELLVDKFNAPVNRQRLFFRGKQLEDGHTLFDYNVNVNDLVQILVKQIGSETKNTSLPKRCSEEVSKENKIGDLVDAIDLVHGSWFEAKIADIKSASISDNNVLQVQQANDQMTKENGATSDDNGLIYQVVFDGYEDCEEPVDLSLHRIRRRARKLIKFEDLKVGDKVMVNYNLEEPKERGFWYDCCVTNLKKGRSTKQLIGTIFVGG